MTTIATITIGDNFGTEASLRLDAWGYPDSREGVLNVLRMGLTQDTPTRPDRFDVRGFRFALLEAWRRVGRPVTAIPSPVDADRHRASFHYDVLPTYHHEATLFVRVSALEEPRGGIGPRAFVPAAAFLLFPTRVRAVELSQADRDAAAGRSAFAGLLARVEEAREGAPVMLGPLATNAGAALACLQLGDWLQARESADREAIAAFHDRGIRALRRQARDIQGRRRGRLTA